jgi:ATP phosphoribosyltransferase
MMGALRPDRLRLALPAEDVLGLTCEHLRACGFEVPDLSLPGLHLVRDPLGHGVDFEVFKLAPQDVGTYVEYGISQLGVMSTDLLREGHARVWHPYTFPYGRWPLVLAAPRGRTMDNLTARPVLRLATSLPSVTRDIFAARGLSIEVVNVEDTTTACLLGLADAYVARLVDPQALVRNGFRVLEVLSQTRLKLVVNPACYAARRRSIQALMRALREHQPSESAPLEIPFDDDEL